MAKLLERVRGGAESNAPTRRHSDVPKPTPAPATIEVPVAPKPKQPPAVARPRVAPPERSTHNIEAMRELANDSARQAIVTSARKQSLRKSLGKFQLAALSAASSGAYWYFVPDPLGINLFVLGTGSAIAMYLGWQGLSLLRPAFFSSAEADADDGEPDDAENNDNARDS